MKSKLEIKKSPDKILKALKRIDKQLNKSESVKVGLPKGSNEYPDGTSVIMVGVINEFGSPSKNIPERSFLRSTVSENKVKYKTLFKKIAVRITEGTMTMSQGLSLVGLQVQTDVRQKITDIKEPPLQHREGNPLIDTGHLRQSIVFKVEE